VSCQRRMLTEADREEISRGIAEDLEGKVIAARIGRCPSVVSREITRPGGRANDRAMAARRVAAKRQDAPVHTTSCARCCASTTQPADGRDVALCRSNTS
jgi:IS30 family transposase